MPSIPGCTVLQDREDQLKTLLGDSHPFLLLRPDRYIAAIFDKATETRALPNRCSRCSASPWPTAAQSSRASRQSFIKPSSTEVVMQTLPDFHTCTPVLPAPGEQGRATANRFLSTDAGHGQPGASRWQLDVQRPATRHARVSRRPPAACSRRRSTWAVSLDCKHCGFACSATAASSKRSTRRCSKRGLS